MIKVAPLFPLCSLLGLAGSLLGTSNLQAQTYTFTTIAGSPGQSGAANGTNNEARFYNPSSIALDSAGNLYVADALNYTIRKVAPSGSNWVVTTIAGLARQSGVADGTNDQARFYRPRGIALDSSGNIFVADNGNNTIRQLSPDGTNWVVSTIAGASPPAAPGFADGTFTNALFRQLTGLASAPSGALFVADMNNHIIRQAEPVGTEWSITTLAGLPGVPDWTDGVGTDAGFASPYALTAADDTTLYVSDSGNNGIRQVKQMPAGWTVTTIAGLLNSPADSVDGEGSVARFYWPVGIARDTVGSLYVADQQNHTIRSLNSTNGSWWVSTIAGKPRESGTNDGVGLDARFNKPWGVAVDSAGVLYVADHSNHTIRKGVPSSTVITGVELNAFYTNKTLVISWPASAASYTLETTASLEPGAVWSVVTTGITSTGDSFLFLTATEATTVFYRLKHK